MATAEELQAQKEIIELNLQHQREIDAARLQAQTDSDKSRARLECVRIASMTLTENKRALPVSEREVSVEEIEAYAERLLAVIYPS